jgi:histidinol-phosphate aminotransferase
MVWSGAGDVPKDGSLVDFITDDLAVSGIEAASDFQVLLQHGIRAVVDASNCDGNPRFPNIRYHEVPIEDPDDRLPDFLPQAVAFIDDARRDGRVLLHCVAGISRSPMLAVCYLHERHGLPLEAALQQVCSRRVQADPHPLFLRLVQDYYAAGNATQAKAVAGDSDATT